MIVNLIDCQQTLSSVSWLDNGAHAGTMRYFVADHYIESRFLWPRFRESINEGAWYIMVSVLGASLSVQAGCLFWLCHPSILSNFGSAL